MGMAENRGRASREPGRSRVPTGGLADAVNAANSASSEVTLSRTPNPCR